MDKIYTQKQIRIRKLILYVTLRVAALAYITASLWYILGQPEI